MFESSKMCQQVQVFTVKPDKTEFHPLDPHDKHKGMTTSNCPLSSIHVPW